MAEFKFSEKDLSTLVEILDYKKLLDVFGHAFKVALIVGLEDVSANLDKLGLGTVTPLVKLVLDNVIKALKNLILPPAPEPTPTPTPVVPTDVVIDVK